MHQRGALSESRQSNQVALVLEPSEASQRPARFTGSRAKLVARSGVQLLARQPKTGERLLFEHSGGAQGLPLSTSSDGMLGRTSPRAQTLQWSMLTGLTTGHLNVYLQTTSWMLLRRQPLLPLPAVDVEEA